MSFTPKSIIFNFGVFLATMMGSIYVAGLILPESGFEPRHERRGHREADRMMREELDTLREINRELEKKLVELEERSASADGVRQAPPQSVPPLIPRVQPPKAGEVPASDGLEKGAVGEF